MMSIRLFENYEKFTQDSLKVPEGVGTWSVDENGEGLMDGMFFMYIEEISPPQESPTDDLKRVQQIKGTIIDFYGKATFEGVVSHPNKEAIKFVKRYASEAYTRTGNRNEAMSYVGYLQSDESGKQAYGGLYKGSFVFLDKNGKSENLDAIIPSERFFLLRLKL